MTQFIATILVARLLYTDMCYHGVTVFFQRIYRLNALSNLKGLGKGRLGDILICRSCRGQGRSFGVRGAAVGNISIATYVISRGAVVRQPSFELFCSSQSHFLHTHDMADDMVTFRYFFLLHFILKSTVLNTA